MDPSLKTFHNPDLKQWSLWILRLLALVTGGIILAGMISSLIILITDLDINRIMVSELTGSEMIKTAWLYRAILMVQHICMFVLPGIIFLYSFKVKAGYELVQINSSTNRLALIAGVGVLLCTYPIVQFGAEVNQLIPLPDILKSMETQSQEVLKLLFKEHALMALLGNLVIMAIIPAIGEEVIFRGIIQSILYRLFSKGHLSVWITAILFSAMHLQFEGFLPRLVLGIILGYLMWWSGKLIYPVVAHFANNALQILVQYFFVKDIEKLSDLENIKLPLPVILFSVVGLMILTGWFQSFFKQPERA